MRTFHGLHCRFAMRAKSTNYKLQLTLLKSPSYIPLSANNARVHDLLLLERGTVRVKCLNEA